jgi:hypothetical protein
VKAEIDKAVSILVGLRLTTDGRAVDMVTLGFGPVREEETRGKLRTIAQYALHIQCPWRLMGGGVVLAGYTDWRFPPAGVSNHGFVPSDAHLTRRDELVRSFRSHGSDAHVVESAEGATAGDLRVVFADGCVLEVFPDFATPDDHDEYWRLFPTGNLERHFLVTPEGTSD